MFHSRFYLVESFHFESIEHLLVLVDLAQLGLFGMLLSQLKSLGLLDWLL